MSFRLKTILGIAVIEAAMLLLLVWNNLSYLDRSFDEELNKRAETTARLFAAISQNAVIATDLASLESGVNELLRTPGVVYARVLGSGRVLAEGGDGTALSRPFVRDYHLGEVDDGRFDTASEITVEGYRFGRVELGLGVDILTQTVEEVRQHNLILALSEIGLVALFSFILGTYLTRQLFALSRASHAIAQGDIGYQIPVRGNDELAETARAFNRMSARLKANYSELQQASTFYEATSEAIMITGADNRIIAVNPAFCRITGYAKEEVLGLGPKLLSSGHHDQAFYADMHHKLEQEGSWQGEIWNRRKNGEVFPEWLSIVAIRDENGEPVQYLSLFSDISKRKRAEQKIWQQANYDALTGLPNRSLFSDRLSQALRRAHREGEQAALMFIDLDRFKWVNDTLGHSAGDELLKEASRRLNGSVRESDTVARLGGDEFTVILQSLHSPHDVEPVAEKILAGLGKPFILEGREVFISGSIGVTLYPQDGGCVETLVRNADAAMYRAKEVGRNTYRFFTKSMNEEAERRLRLETDMRKALQQRGFEVHYQPIMELQSGEVIGAEALLRWQHPQLGWVPPDEFIPLAEELGLTTELEPWVLRCAAREAAGWPESMIVSINSCGTLFQNGDYTQQVTAGLNTEGLAPSRFKLEITERLMMSSQAQVLVTMKALREAGVGLAVDDFGTGYSSLSYLKRFPVDFLKIDRMFVKGLPDDAEDAALVEAITAMAHSLGLKVIAEGVESREQLDFLTRLGCDYAQGFLFSPALPPQAFLAYLQESGQVRTPVGTTAS